MILKTYILVLDFIVEGLKSTVVKLTLYLKPMDNSQTRKWFIAHLKGP